MKRAALCDKIIEVSISVDNTNGRRINFQAIDSRINSDYWDGPRRMVKGPVSVPKEAFEEIVEKLKQHSNIITVNDELTKLGEKIKKEKEELEAQREELQKRIQDTPHIEVFFEVDPSSDGVSFTKIDPRIIDIGTFGQPAHLVIDDPKEAGECFNPGSLFFSVFVPKEAAEEIIEKLKQSQYILSINGEFTKKSIDQKSKQVSTTSTEINVLFGYTQHVKNYVVASAVLGAIGVGLYLVNRST